MIERLVVRAAGGSHAGLVRPTDEDHALVRDDLGLYLVADGAGGHHAGEVASALAARSISNYLGATVRAAWERPDFDRFGVPHDARRLSAAVLKANRDILEVAAASPRHRGMGTTVVALLFSRRTGQVHVAHAGDSRCYRLRGGHLELLTQDHSLENDLLEQRPELDEAVLARLPRHVVTRALGMAPDLRVSVQSRAVAPGDRYLLCTDGLSGPVEPAVLHDLLSRSPEPEDAQRELLLAALERGAPDNVGLVVVHCEDASTPSLRAREPLPSLPPRSHRDSFDEPELLILGIEEVDATRFQGRNPRESAHDGLLEALEDLVDARRGR